MSSVNHKLHYRSVSLTTTYSDIHSPWNIPGFPRFCPRFSTIFLDFPRFSLVSRPGFAVHHLPEAGGIGSAVGGKGEVAQAPLGGLRAAPAKSAFVYRIFSWCMWFYDDLWWFMVIYGNLEWLMMTSRDLWWFMMISRDLWWFMVIYCDLWWSMVICGDWWKRRMIND